MPNQYQHADTAVQKEHQQDQQKEPPHLQPLKGDRVVDGRQLSQETEHHDTLQGGHIANAGGKAAAARAARFKTMPSSQPNE